jgi:hypothetical protein
MVHWKNAAKKFVVSSMVLGAALLLNACGGGDSGSSIVGSGSSGGGSVGSGGGSGGSGGGSGGSGGGTTATYLVYTVEGGGLYLVDPANPTQPIKITDKAVTILTEEYAVSSLDPNTKQYKDLHVRAIYYKVEGDKGPLMRLSLVKGSSTPQPVQVSNLTNVCDVLTSEDLVIPHVMIVRTADGNCDTPNGQYIVTSDMTSNSKPIDVTGKDVVTFVSGNDLKVKGAIIKESNTLKYCNIDLSNNSINCDQKLAPSVTVTAVDDIASNTQNEYLCVDGQIQIFDKSKNTLSQTSTVCENGGNYYQDDEYIYHVNNKNIERLYMNDVTAGWQTIYSGGDIDYIEGMTQNYLIASVTNSSNNTTQLLAINKKDFSKTVISDGNFFIATPNRLYFTKYTQDSNGTIVNVNACYWDEGSANPSCDSDGTDWVGFSFAVDGTLNYSSYFRVSKLLKVEGSNGGKGGTLYAVDHSNFNKINLGNIPSNFSVGGGGIGDNILLLGYDTSNPLQYLYDVFFANLSIPNSLKNITNTPNKNEIPF